MKDKFKKDGIFFTTLSFSYKYVFLLMVEVKKFH